MCFYVAEGESFMSQVWPKFCKIFINIIVAHVRASWLFFNSLRPSDAYMRQ